MKKIFFVIVVLLLIGCGNKSQSLSDSEKKEIEKGISALIKTNEGIGHNVSYGFTENNKHYIDIFYYGGNFKNFYECRKVTHNVLLNLMDSEEIKNISKISFYFLPDNKATKTLHSFETIKIPKPEDYVDFNVHFDNYVKGK